MRVWRFCIYIRNDLRWSWKDLKLNLAPFCRWNRNQVVLRFRSDTTFRIYIKNTPHTCLLHACFKSVQHSFTNAVVIVTYLSLGLENFPSECNASETIFHKKCHILASAYRASRFLHRSLECTDQLLYNLFILRHLIQLHLLKKNPSSIQKCMTSLLAFGNDP